jgi:hypothetical protein
MCDYQRADARPLPTSFVRSSFYSSPFLAKSLKPVIERHQAFLEVYVINGMKSYSFLFETTFPCKLILLRETSWRVKGLLRD